MKTETEEAVTPAGDGARSERQERPEWRYIETPLAAEVEAGDIRLRPHWKGVVGADEIRAVVRKAAAAPELYEAARFALSVLKVYPMEMSERMAIEKLAAALALVGGPQEVR